MKKGMIIVFGILTVLTGLSKVNAQSTTEWGGNVEQGFTDLYMYDLTSTSYSQLGLSLDQFQRYGTNDILTSYGNANKTTLGPNGTMLAFDLNQRTMNGYLYSITVYQCATSEIYSGNTIADLFVGAYPINVASRPANTTMYQATNINRLKGEDLYCYMTTSLFVPNTNTDNSWIGLRLRASGANIPNIYMRAYGFTIKEMGIYNETIKDTIKNSGFATAQSVAEVNTSVNQVKQEVAELNNSVDQTNNILTQDHNYNKNESQSTQGQKQEIDNYEKEEDNLRNKLNLNIENTEISVNPNANNFIWEVVNKLRTMSGKIVLLFTSVLSLGIMKMILGR